MIRCHREVSRESKLDGLTSISRLTNVPEVRYEGTTIFLFGIYASRYCYSPDTPTPALTYPRDPNYLPITGIYCNNEA